MSELISIAFNRITLHRRGCLDKIPSGLDGDICFTIPVEAYVDIKDAKVIVDEINTRPNDAKAMIAEGLGKVIDSLYEPVSDILLDKTGGKPIGGYNYVEPVLDALFEVCKQSSEGEE